MVFRSWGFVHSSNGSQFRCPVPWKFNWLVSSPIEYSARIICDKTFKTVKISAATMVTVSTGCSLTVLLCKSLLFRCYCYSDPHCTKKALGQLTNKGVNIANKLSAKIRPNLKPSLKVLKLCRCLSRFSGVIQGCMSRNREVTELNLLLMEQDL